MIIHKCLCFINRKNSFISIISSTFAVYNFKYINYEELFIDYIGP